MRNCITKYLKKKKKRTADHNKYKYLVSRRNVHKKS